MIPNKKDGLIKNKSGVIKFRNYEGKRCGVTSGS